MNDHLDERCRRLIAAADLDDGVIVAHAGDPVAIAGTDQFHPFQAHPEFRYLAGVEVESAVVAVDVATGERELFAPHPDVDDRVWHAADAPGAPIDQLDEWLDRRGGPVRRLGDVAAPDTALRAVLDDLRVRKDAAELDAMRRAAAATRAGFEALVAQIAPGRTERQLQAVIDGGFGFAGGDRPAYDSIVAGGPNAAVLHFAPSVRPLDAGDFLLVDAGARVEGYACDVTRTWTVGSASERHRNLWEAVVAAQQLAVARCVPGAEYRRIHLDTARDLASSFVELGLLRGEPDDLVARGAMAVFFPHGVGHLIGQNVHDTGGYAPGRERTDVGGTRYLRTDRTLEPSMTVTIEPGVYFIDALLDDGGVRQRHDGDIDWSVVDDYRGIGGVRIEDTVHVTADGPEVLSGAIPIHLEASSRVERPGD